jgi:phage terminase small subunit
MTIEEKTIGEGDVDIIPAWQTHDWSADEVRFASAYLRTGNMTRAYMETFPDVDLSPAAASMRGHRMVAHPWMAGYIAHVQDALKQRLLMTKETVLEELAKLGYANFSDFVVLHDGKTPQFDFSGLSRDQMAAISELTIDTYVVGKSDPENEGREVRSVKVKLAPKLGALEALGKHFKLFTDVLEVGDTTDVADELQRARRMRQARLAKEDDDGSDEADDD